MQRRTLLRAAGVAAAMLALGGAALAQETVKIGLILPMTGPFASTGRQIEAAAKLYMQQKGDTVAGKKIELILKDDTGVADVTKRLAQELIVNDKVAVHGRLRPHPARRSPPLRSPPRPKVPVVVMAAAPRSSPRPRPSSCAPASPLAQVDGAAWPNGRPRTASSAS